MSGQWKGTSEAIEQAGLSLNRVWLRYFSISGEAGEYEIDAYLNGSFTLSTIQADLLSHAVNELINEILRPRAPYSSEQNKAIADRGNGFPEDA